MADRLGFELSLTSEMAEALRPVVSQLNATDAAMNKVRIDSAQMESALKHFRGSQHEKGFLEAAIASHKHAAELPNLRNEVKLLSDQGKGFRVEWGNVVQSFAGFRKETTGGWIFNAAEGMRAFGGGALWAGQRIASLAMSMAKAVAKAEDLDLALKLNVGEKVAGNISGIAGTFGNTRHDDDTIKEALLPIAEAKIADEKLLSALATSAADIAAMTAGKTSAVGAGEIFGHIALKRDVNDKMLKDLALNADDFFVNLGKQLGKTAKDAKKLAGEGKITGDVLLRTVVDELAKKQGGTIGGAGLAAGKTMGASLQRLSDLPENWFKGARGTEGMVKLQGAIDGVVASFSAGGDSARALSETIGVLVDVGGFVVDVFGKIGDAIGWVTAQQVLLFTGIYDVGEKLYRIGGQIVEGFALGLSEGWGAVKGAVDELGNSTVNWFKEKLGIASPSTVFARLGEYTGEGFAVGLDRSADRVGDATQRLLTDGMAPGPASQALAARGADSSAPAGGYTFHFNITGSNAREIGDEIEERVERIMARTFDRAALSGAA